MGANVQKVSREDIAKARNGAAFSVSKESSDASKINPQSRKGLSYIARLKDDEIAKFFAQFGYLNHERFDSQTGVNLVRVNCAKFDAIFSDFDIAICLYPESRIPSENFDFDSFMAYCTSNDLAPEQTISDMIHTDLLGAKFPSYAEARQTQKDATANASYMALPKSMRPMFKSINEKLLATNKLEGNKGRYGSFDSDKFKGTSTNS